ncbi:MAG: enoyl-CoA hydratase-related protein [Verrucomicrobiota bacterium]
MSDPLVSFSSRDGIGVITFNRPPANAYNLGFHEEFNAAIAAADADGPTRVVILRSALERFFCAGADIKEFASNSTDDNKRMVDSARRALAAIEASGKLFIACLQGHALGGGLEIAMACDLRFGAEGNFKLGLPETKLGLLPGNGGSQRLPRIVGASQALALLASGESIAPQEAARIGLIDRLFSAEAIVAETESFAAQVASSAPLAVAASKRAVNEGLDLEFSESLALEARLVDELYETEDAKEGFQSFVEKRPPNYQGR